MSTYELDADLQTLRDSLREIEDERFYTIQAKRNRRLVASRLDGEYNLARMLQAMERDEIARDCPYEKSVSDGIAQAVGRQPRPGCLFVPIDRRRRSGRRDLNATVGGEGQFLVGANLAPGNLFVHYLDQFFLFQRLGIQRLTLDRPCTIPGMSGTVSTGWLADETSTLSESQFTFATGTSSPKTVGGYVEISRQLLKQASPFALNFVMQALARAVAAELSRKLLTGSGLNGELVGVFNYPAVNTVAAASANYEAVLDLVQAVEADSALLTPASAAFVMPGAVARLLRSREKSAGSGMVMEANTVAGYPGIVTEGASPNTLTFGDFSQLCLLDYSILEIGTDPYGANSALFKKGVQGVRALWSVDAVLLNGTSFCTTGALT